MIGIYKITNKLNEKSYVGLSVDIEHRWKEHKSQYSWERESGKTLYKAMKKYGVENFTFEVLEECSKEELKQKERYWISAIDSYKNGYNQTCGGEDFNGENHPRHKLTEEDVINIRVRYMNKERRKDVYIDYNNRIGESGFGKVWKGETWKTVMMEVYSEENKLFHKHNTANTGSENGRAKLTDSDVRDIRMRRKNGEVLKVVYEDYKDKVSYGSFANVWSYQNWKSIIV